MSLFEQQYDQPLVLPLRKPQLPPPAPLPTDRPGSYYDRVMRPGARQSSNIEDWRQPLSDPADIAAAKEYARVIGRGPEDTARFNLATGAASWVTGRDWEDQKALARTLVTRLNSPGRSPHMRNRIDGGPVRPPANTMVARPQVTGIKPVELSPQTQPPLRPTQPMDPVGFAPTDSMIGNQTEVMQRQPDLPVARQRRVWTPEAADANNRRVRERLTQVMAGRRAVENQDEVARQGRMQERMRPPPVGHVVSGWRYIGGDPRRQTSWQRMNPGEV